MKKHIVMLLILALLFSLPACRQGNAKDLINDDSILEVYPKEILNPVPDTETGNGATADFAVRLFQNSMEEGKNTLISPMSVLYALAMTANGADGETLAQMEKVFGMDIRDLNGYLFASPWLNPDTKGNKLYLSNSIWFKDDPNFEVNKTFLGINRDYYGAGAYQAPFDENTRNEINDWVKTNTKGMIPEIIDEIPEDAVMYLVNALAFEAQWEKIYDEFQVQEGHFTTEDGTRQDVEMMHSQEHYYLEDELATGFIKYYEGREYAFVALLPNEGVTVQEYADSLTGGHLQEMLASSEEMLVFTTIPKFESEYDIEMSQALQGMGMTNAFDWQVADFSRLGTYNVDGMNICISRVLHKTFISVAEQGTRAGAATAVEMPAYGAMEIPEFKEVVLDRPFVYMIIDCETNLPFFMGTMMDVNGG